MNAKTIAIGTMVLASVLAGGLAWRDNHRRLKAEEAVARATARKTAAAAEEQSIATSLAAVEKARAELQTTLDGFRPTAPAAEPPKKAAAAIVPPDQMELIRQDPKLQKLFVASQRAALATRYGAFFRQAGLSPEQVDKFDAIMIRRAEQDLDLEAVARAQGFISDNPALAALRQQAEKETDEAQAALLGPEGFAEYQEFQRTLGPRVVLGGFVAVAATEGAALSGDQFERVVQIVANASASYRNGGKPDPANPDDINWDSVEQQLRGVLSDAQLTLYRRMMPRTSVSDWFANVFERAVKDDLAKSPELRAKPGG